MAKAEAYKKQLLEKKAALAKLKAGRAAELQKLLAMGKAVKAAHKETAAAQEADGAMEKSAQRVVDLAAQIAEAEQEISALEIKCYKAEQKEMDKLKEEAEAFGEQLKQQLRAKAPADKLTILFLAANPAQTAALALDQEARSIMEMIRKADCRDSIEFETRWAVRPLDILQAINEVEPEIIHFSGHGSEDGELVLSDDNGNAKYVTKEAIVDAIAATSDKARLVFFNACFSEIQAKAIVEKIEAAVGMRISIGDRAACVFAAQFYSAIGFGKSLAQAFGQAKAALLLEGIPEENTPAMYVRAGLDPKEIALVQRAE